MNVFNVHAWSIGMAWMKSPPTLTPVSSSSPVAVARSNASFKRWQNDEFTCNTLRILIKISIEIDFKHSGAHLYELLHVEEDAGKLVRGEQARHKHRPGEGNLFKPIQIKLTNL